MQIMFDKSKHPDFSDSSMLQYELIYYVPRTKTVKLGSLAFSGLLLALGTLSLLGLGKLKSNFFTS